MISKHIGISHKKSVLKARDGILPEPTDGYVDVGDKNSQICSKRLELVTKSYRRQYIRLAGVFGFPVSLRVNNPLCWVRATNNHVMKRPVLWLAELAPRQFGSFHEHYSATRRLSTSGNF